MSTQNLNTIICTNLEEFEQNIENLFVVRIPDGVTHIPDGAFKNGHLIKEVILPASLETIGNEAFMNCDNLETVTFLGNNLTSIGNSAFDGCTSLHVPTFGDHVTVGTHAFYGCIRPDIFYAASSKPPLKMQHK